MIRWRIYYIDGSSFSHLDGSPQDAPGGGVAAVAQEDHIVGVMIHEQSDFYVFAEQYGGWYGLDKWGFAQYLMRPGMKIIKLGETQTTKRQRQLKASLRKDPALPAKSARYPWEAPS